MKQYNASLIGTGRIGFSLMNDRRREQPASHTAALLGNKRISLKSACDSNEENLRAFHKRVPKAVMYTSTNELLTHEHPDIIVIAVNENAHHEVTLQAIQSKPRLIILEKPIALTLKEADEIKTLSTLHHVPILINHERRYSLDYQIVKNLLDKNTIGNIESVYGTLSSSLKIYDSNELHSGHYSLIHDGTHLIDIIHYLLGTTLTTPGSCTFEKDDKGSIRYLSTVFKENNTMIHLEISGKRNYFGFDIDIRGTKGRICIGNGYLQVYKSVPSPYYTGFKSLQLDSHTRRPAKTRYFSNMMDNAVKYLDGRASLISSLDDGIATLTTIKEIEKHL